MKKLITLLAVALITSCVITPPLQSINLTEAILIDFPQQGVIVTASLGERLVAKGYKEEGPAYELSEGMLVPSSGSSLTGPCAVINLFSQSRFVQRKQPNGDMCAGLFNVMNTLDSGGTSLKCPGNINPVDICYSDSNNNFYTSNGFATTSKLGIDSNLIKKVKKTTTTNVNFIQEFIYNGKVNNEVKFIYREFSEDMIRPAFNQSVQYDYDESKFISFKGLNIEIIEANNQIIKYKLLSNF